MRIVIKGADFSANSIGKVGKDLSFSYTTDAELKSAPWDNIVSHEAALPWSETDGNVTNTTIYLASESSQSFTTMVANTRIMTEYIEVVPGMVISGRLPNTTTVPLILCFDENKNILGPSTTYNKWVNGASDFSFTIPASVKYIKVCVTALYAAVNYSLVGTMPE